MERSTASSTSPFRKYSMDCHDLPSVKPNKYKAIFDAANPLRQYSPRTRINDNQRQITVLRCKLSNTIQKSCFFDRGTQKNDDHFKKLLKEFFVHVRGVDPLVANSARALVSKFGRYKDVCITAPDRNRPTPELLEELKELLDQKQGLQKELIAIFNKNSRKLTPKLQLHDWESTHGHGGNVPANDFFTYLGKKLFLNLNPIFSERFKDIYTKILEIVWLEKDIKQVKDFIEDPSSPTRPISPFKSLFADTEHKSVSSFSIFPQPTEKPDGFTFNDMLYRTIKTKGDGACGLHALLGDFVDGEWQYIGDKEVKALFLEKINEPEREPIWKAELVSIIRGHLQSEDDPSAKMLFENDIGEQLKTSFQSIKPQYDEIRQGVKTQEAKEWLPLLAKTSFKTKILESAHGLGQERYAGKSNEQILTELKRKPLQLLDLINENRDYFLSECYEEKARLIADIQANDKALLAEMTALEDRYILGVIYEFYALVLPHPLFFLNTQELELAACLFNKKMQVIHLDGDGNVEANTNLINGYLPGDPIVIHHEGAHFSRCIPCSDDDMEEISIRKNYSQALKESQAAIDNDERMSKKFWSNVKEETAKMAMAGAFSLGTGNPVPFGVQLARSGVNTASRCIDPEEKSKVLQGAKLVANSGVSKVFGGNLAHVVGGFAVDAAGLYINPEKMTKEETSLRGIGAACVKGVLTGNPSKFAENVLGQVVSDASREFVPEEKATDGAVLRLVRSAVTSSDLHGVLVDSIVKDPPKKTPQKDTGQAVEVDPDSKSKFPKQVLDEKGQPKVQITVEEEPKQSQPVSQDRSHLLDAPPESLPIHYRMDKDDKNDYRIYIYHEGETPKAVGRFYSEGKAVEAVTALNDYVRQVNTLNAESYGDQRLYESLGLNPNDLANTLQFKPIYPAINAPGDKSKAKVYLGDERILKTSSNTDAFNTFKDLLSKDIAAKTNARSAYKTEMDGKAPSHILPPKGTVHAPFDSKDNKYHRLSYIDDSGKSQGLGKYPTAEEARRVSSGWSKLQVTKAEQERQCYEARGKLVKQGISLDKIPAMPTFEVPVLDGKNADKSYQKIAESNVRNARLAAADLKNIQGLSPEPILVDRLSRSEKSRIAQDMIPKMKDPKDHSVFYKAWRAPGQGLRWLDEHGVSLSVNVNISTPLYKTKSPSSTPSHAGVYGYDAPRKEPIVPKPSFGSWENVQEMVAGKIFNANMAYQSPKESSPQSSPIDYHSFWGQGLAKDVQAPPMDLDGLGRNEIVPHQNIHANRHIQMAGLLPFVLTKVVPEQTQRKVETWVKDFVQQWKDDPIKARKDLDLCLILGAKNAVVIAIQAFEQPSLKTRHNAFGLMEASDKFDNWFAGKANIDLTSPNAQMAMFVGEIAMPIPVVGAFKHCTKVGQEAFAFMRQSARAMRPQPLLDRAFAFPQGFSKEVRAIEAFQNPVYRSGFVHNKAVEQARKAVNLPSWKKMSVKIDHVISGHTNKGHRTMCDGAKKTLFPENLTRDQIENIIRQAYRYGKKTRTQREKVIVVGKHQGIKVEMWVDIKNKTIDTAYPIR